MEETKISKQEFKQRARSTVEGIFREIDLIENKVVKSTKKPKEELNKILTELKSRKPDLKATYDQIEHATENTWEEAKNSFTKSASQFKFDLTKAESMLN